MRIKYLMAAAMVAVMPSFANADSGLEKASFPLIKDPDKHTTCKIAVPGSEETEFFHVRLTKGFVAQIQQAFNARGAMLEVDGICGDFTNEAMSNDLDAGPNNPAQVMKYSTTPKGKLVVELR